MAGVGDADREGVNEGVELRSDMVEEDNVRGTVRVLSPESLPLLSLLSSLLVSA